jgi:hypothetical protein
MPMNEIYSLDLETKPLNPNYPYAALEPWRVRQGLAEISSVAISYPDGTSNQWVNNAINWVGQVTEIVDSLNGKTVYCHNAPFDVAFIISTIQTHRRGCPSSVKGINWRDTRLLAKWLVNGQLPEKVRFSYSLKNLCKCSCRITQNWSNFWKLRTRI